MTETLKTIWNSKYGNLVIFLAVVTIGGVYLYFDRPNVSTRDDLTKVSGRLDHIDQVLVYSRKINKTERDSTYHIFLREYPCKFQVSYMSYDRKGFYKSASPGDEVTLQIANEDFDRLKVPDAKIRSFSLTVNDNVYLSADNGLRGFGKGYFELGLIVISLTVNFFVIKGIIKNKRTAANKG